MNSPIKDKTINDIVVKKLNEYLRNQKITQYQLSKRSGISYATIKSIMQKRTKDITLKTIILLAYGLNITPSEFINSDEFLAENLNLN